MLTLSNITGIVLGPDGQALAGATLEFQLSGADTESATASVAVPQRKLFVLTAGGAMPAGAQIWRNTRGLRGTSYILTARWTETEVVGGMTVQRERSYRFPNAVQVGEAASYSVRELLDNPVPEAPGFSVNLDPAAFAALQANIALANASAGVAQSAANVAGAQIFATAAEGIAAVAVGGIFYVPLSPSGGLDIRQKTGASTSVSIGQFLPPTQNPLDTTAGRLTRVGDFGLGGPGLLLSGLPLLRDRLLPTGHYTYQSNATLSDGPEGANVWVRSLSVIEVPPTVVGGGNSRRIFIDTRTTGTGLQRMWLGANQNADPIVWREVYTSGSIMGQVTQVAGIPTGALREPVTNANGRAERDFSGSAECWRETLSAPNANIAAGSRFRSADVTWTFPSAFLAGSTPVVTGSVVDADCDLRLVSVSNTQAVFRVLSDVSKSGALTILAHAKGRWSSMT